MFELLAVDLARGTGIARAEQSCALHGACPGAEMHLVFKSAALQMLRDDIPTLSQGVHSMRCFMSRFVRDAMGTLRAASSGGEHG